MANTMSKMMGSWGGMRKYLEEEMLAESLRGRVRYQCTTFVGMDGCHVFELHIDQRLVKRFSLETVNSYFIRQGYREKDAGAGIRGYWDGFWELMHSFPMQSRTEYTDGEFCDALCSYRNQPIADSLKSENPLTKMFAILDRRTGKRTLAALRERMAEEPQWLRSIYRTRMDAEA